MLHTPRPNVAAKRVFPSPERRRSRTSPLGNPRGVVAFFQLSPQSTVSKTPESVATNHALSGAEGRRVIANNGVRGRILVEPCAGIHPPEPSTFAFRNSRSPM